MTQKENQILLKDLCTRVPHGVKFACNKNVYTAKGVDLIVTDEGNWEYAVTAKGIVPIEISFIKPYLRPMSSMTKAERAQLEFAQELDTRDAEEISISNVLEFFLEHHLDHRNLIGRGLALEAPEGMYNI